MKKILFSILFVGILFSAALVKNWDKTPQTHAALFETFFPLERVDEATLKLALHQREQILASLVGNSDLKPVFFLLNHFWLPHTLLAISDLFSEKSSAAPVSTSQILYSFSDLSVSECEKQIDLLIGSEIGILRQIGFGIKLAYTSKIYDGALGAKVAGVKAKGREVLENLKIPNNLITHLKYNKQTNAFEGELDYVVIGSGPAGSVVAHELQAAGKRVLVLEKGPLIIPGAINAIDNSDFFDGQNPSPEQHGNMLFSNASVVGGGTMVNVDMAVPPTSEVIRHRFHNWHKENKLNKSLWTDSQINSAYAWVKNKVKPLVAADFEANKNNKLFKLGAEQLGLTVSNFQLTSLPTSKTSGRINSKVSAFDAFLWPAMKASANQVTVLPQAEVVKIEVNRAASDKHASGVYFNVAKPSNKRGIWEDPYGFKLGGKKSVFVKAKHVILAAGALGSSKVLLKSGFKNKNIGKGFVAHPFMAVSGLFDQTVDAYSGRPSTYFSDHHLPTDAAPNKKAVLFESASGPMDLMGLYEPADRIQTYENVKLHRHRAGMAMIMIDEVNEKNEISISALGGTQINYEMSASDKQRYAFGCAEAMRILLKAGALQTNLISNEAFLGPQSITVKNVSEAKKVEKMLEVKQGQNLVVGAHMMASNKMGVDPEKSVVGPDYAYWGVPNLFVVDSSIYPGSVGANPMMTIYTTAKIFVDNHLKSQAHI